MTEIRFARLAEFRAAHEYYRKRDGELQRRGVPVRIAPTAATCRSLRDRGVLFKRTEAGFVLLYELDDPATPSGPAIRPLTGRLSWSFVLRAHDPYLESFSDLPLRRRPDQLYYLGNRAAPAPAAADEPLRLTRQNSLSGDDLLRLRPPRFSVAISSTVGEPLATVYDAWDTMVLERRVVPVEGRSMLDIDLSSRRAGRYRLEVEGVGDAQHFYCDPELQGPAPFAVLEIASSTELPEHVRLADADGVPRPKTLSLAVDARRTVWRYYVGLKYRSETNPSELSIVSSSPAIAFTARSPVPKAGLDKVVPFDSDTTLLPYRSEPLRGVQLTKSTDVTPGALTVENLPNPAPSTLREDPDSGTLYSEAFIYI